MISPKTERKLFVLILLIGIAAVMPRFWNGAGNNWDGIFPYWREQIPGWLNSLTSAWNQTGTGTPVGYTTGSLVTFLYYPFYLLHIKSELILYLVVSAIMGATAYLSFLLIRKHATNQLFWLAAFLALLTILNPAIFYKLLAGHLYYLIGYMGFVGLLYFLSKNYPKKIFIPGLGLLLALSGSQVQFFIFSAVVVGVWWVFNRKKYPWWAYVAGLGIALLIHSYWIIGFLTGSNDISTLGARAAENSFEGLSTTSLLRVLVLSFSPATFITKFYNGVLLLPGALLVLSLPIVLVFSRRFDKNATYYMSLFVIFALIATGAFQQFPVPVLSRFYPMLREAGHAAPIVVAMLIFALAELSTTLSKKIVSNSLLTFIGAYVALNTYIYWNYVPRVDFQHARQAFESYYEFNKTDQSSYRLLTYPFFNQYSFVGQPQLIRKGTPMSNSGWDSFTIFSGKEYIDNAVPAIPSQFQDSVQYRFLSSYDTAVLQPYGVKYIYDFSTIYQSNFAKFSSPEVYNDNPSVLQNDPNFLTKVLEKNPSSKLVAPGVVQLTDQLPRLYAGKSTFTRISPTEYHITIDPSSPQTLSFLSSYHKGWQLVALPNSSKVSCDNPITYANGARECIRPNSLLTGQELGYSRKTSLFEDSHAKADYANSWKINPTTAMSLGEKYITNTDGTPSLTLALYYRPQAQYFLALIVSVLTILSAATFIITQRRFSK